MTYVLVNVVGIHCAKYAKGSTSGQDIYRKTLQVGPVYRLLATEDGSWTSAGKNGGWVVYCVTTREAKVCYIEDASKNREMLVGGKF